MTAPALYNANRRVTDNNGDANTNNPPAPAIHAPPGNVVSDYARSAGYLGAIATRHVRTALQSSLLHAANEATHGKTPRSLNNDSIMEQACLGTAMEIADGFSRDSVHADWLNATTAAAGVPSTHTTLPDGRRFNTRDIPTCNRNHRESNNRLAPITNNQPPAARGQHGVSSNLFPCVSDDSTQQARSSYATRDDVQENGATPAACFDDADIASAIQNLLVQLGPTPSVPSVPPNFANRDDVLSPLTFQNSVIQGVGLNGLTEDEVRNIYDLKERALKRSFTESGAPTVYNVDDDVDESACVRARATKRVNWIIDNEEKSIELIRLCLVADQDVTSPKINRTFDHFQRD